MKKILKRNNYVKAKQSVFNKHFFKLLLVFLSIIILTLAFSSFIKEALKIDKDINKKSQKF